MHLDVLNTSSDRMHLCARTVEMTAHLMTDSPPARLHVLTEKPLSVHKAG
jgi:hypothetical protein